MATIPYEPIAHSLNSFYGSRTWRPGRKGLEELVLTILSQSTTDKNSGRAYLTLRQTFPIWQELAGASVAEVEQCIRVAGLAHDKATRIVTVLNHHDVVNNDFSIDFLAGLSLDDACAWLTAFDGVGPKTAGCVLLFAYGMPILPVDTHIQRVAQRLGLVTGKSPERAHIILNRVIPATEKYAAHMHLIQLGRQICHARKPNCAECPLQDLCPSKNG